METREPKRAGATLKNFFAQNSKKRPKSNFYIFLTFMYLNAVVCTYNYTNILLIIIYLYLIM